MRKLKWTAAIVVIAMIIVTALYVRRDHIATELANSALSETDLEVVDLSVSSLGVARIELSRLVVTSASGNRFEIRGLSAPLNLGSGMNEVFADSLEVEFRSDRTERQALSDTVRRLLAVPVEQPDLIVSIDEVTLPDVPVIENAAWTTIGNRQNAKLEVDGHSIEIFVDGDATDGYRVSVLALDEEVGAELEIPVSEGNVEMRGDLRLRVGDWLPTLLSMDLLPEGLKTIETELSGPVTIELDSEDPGHIAVEAALSPTNGANIDYSITSGTSVRFESSAVDELNIRFAYPEMSWMADSASIDGLVTLEESTFPLLLNNLECEDGIRCTMYATIYGEQLSWADYAADTASIASPIVVQTGDVTLIDIPSDASVVLTGIRVGEISASAAEVVSFSGTQVSVDEGWQSSVDALQFAVDGLEVAETISASGTLGVSSLMIANSGDTVDAEISLSAGATATLNDLLVSLPGLSGTATRRGSELRSELVVQDAAIEAGIDLVRNLDSGEGTVSVRDARVSFDYAHLSDYVGEWPFVWDVMSGVLTADASLDWQPADEGFRYSGTMAANLQKVSGVWEDYAFVGVTTSVRGVIDSVEGIALDPSRVTVPLIDVGLPLENLTADYRIDADNRLIFIENLAMEALGGRITAEPFTFAPLAEVNELRFEAEAVQLSLISDLANFQSLDMSGSISGEIPVSIGADSIGVDGGQLASDDPGGFIRYSSNDTEGTDPEGNLAIVKQALRNFEFDTLTSSVDYDSDGNLVLSTRLSGVNPDIDPNQPYVLNVNVDTNIPQMLRSLRAIRTIEDILEERTAE